MASVIEKHVEFFSTHCTGRSADDHRKWALVKRSWPQTASGLALCLSKFEDRLSGCVWFPVLQILEFLWPLCLQSGISKHWWIYYVCFLSPRSVFCSNGTFFVQNVLRCFYFVQWWLDRSHFEGRAPMVSKGTMGVCVVGIIVILCHLFQFVTITMLHWDSTVFWLAEVSFSRVFPFN